MIARYNFNKPHFFPPIFFFNFSISIIKRKLHYHSTCFIKRSVYYNLNFALLSKVAWLTCFTTLRWRRKERKRRESDVFPLKLKITNPRRSKTSRFFLKYLKDLKIRLFKWHVVSKDTEVEQPTGQRRSQRGRLHSICQVGVKRAQTLSSYT